MKTYLYILVLLILLIPAPVQADEGCVPNYFWMTGSGTAVQGFVPGEAYIGVRFQEEMDELIFLELNSQSAYEITYQGADGFSAIVYGDDLEYTYLVGGSRCAMIYRAYLPLVIDE